MIRSRLWNSPRAVGIRPTLRQKASLHFEPLEFRAMLSASSCLVAQPTFSDLASVTNTSPRGYTPSQVSSAYGFNQIAFSGGTVQGNGSGQTIAIVDAYDDPNIASDLATFDQKFGLAAPASFTKLNENGGSVMPKASASWSEEIALDVEWAHAMAPGANIVLVEANSSSLTDLMAAVNMARNLANVSVVSMSWGTSEFSGETQYDSYFTTPAGHTGITFVASAGDTSAERIWPSVSPNVVSVGGTSLNLSVSSYASESAWTDSGGGYSQYESEPSYQTGVQSSGKRSAPDVAYDANPNTGFAVYDSVSTGGQSGWFEIGGTSAGAPQWSALIAIADQGRALNGQGTIAGAQTALYSLPSTDFHDVASGSNGYAAQAGYDLVTGRGTPIANSVVSSLVSGTSSTTSPPAQTPAPTPAPAPTPTPTPPSHSHYYYEIIYYHGRFYIVEISSPDAVDSTGPGTIDAGGGAGNSGGIAGGTPGLGQVATGLTTGTTTAAASAESTTAGPTLTSTSSAVQPANAPTAMAVTGLVLNPSSRIVSRNAVVDKQERSGSEHGDEQQDESAADATTETVSAPGAEGWSRDAEPGSASVAAAPSPVAIWHSSAGPVVEGVLDACFGDDSWTLPLDDAVAGIADSFESSRDFDLAVLAISLAIGVSCSKRQFEEIFRPGVKPRRDVTGLTRV